jgi:hypothetical protein
VLFLTMGVMTTVNTESRVITQYYPALVLPLTIAVAVQHRDWWARLPVLESLDGNGGAEPGL